MVLWLQRQAAHAGDETEDTVASLPSDPFACPTCSARSRSSTRSTDVVCPTP